LKRGEWHGCRAPAFARVYELGVGVGTMRGCNGYGETMCCRCCPALHLRRVCAACVVPACLTRVACVQWSCDRRTAGG
jgi:hypothetical protein